MRVPNLLDMVDTIDPLGINSSLFACRAGEDWCIPLNWTLADGTTPENLSSRTFAIKIGKIATNNIASVFFSGTSSDTKGQGGVASINCPSPTNGIMNASIAATYTSSFSPGSFRYGIYDTTGGKNELMVEGQYDILAAIGK